MKPDPAIPKTWIALLNEQTEWDSPEKISDWLSQMLQRPCAANQKSLKFFWDTLTYIREVIYAVHFGEGLDADVLNARLSSCRFSFHAKPIGYLPPLRAESQSDDSSLLIALANTYLLAFAQDLAKVITGEGEFVVARCEGLYRDPKLQRLGAAPDIADEVELRWRREVEVLTEKGIEDSTQIHRCADLFIGNSRSRFCSDRCRTITFQLIKQLVNPNYLAEKQRRYRSKKQ
jgi:hypothetical protein